MGNKSGVEMKDKKNVEDQEEIGLILDACGEHNSNPKNVTDGLKMIVENMMYNFEKISDRLHTHTASIKTTILQLEHQTEAIDEIKKETKEVKEAFLSHELIEARSYRKYIVSLVGLGALGALVIILQIINLVFVKK